MNHTTLIKKLRGITHKHYEQNSIGEVQFYSDFAYALHDFFEESLKTQYLFSFPFVSEKGKQINPSKEYLVSKWLSEEERREIKNHLSEGERRLNNPEECISVTRLMVENLLGDEIQSLLIKRIVFEAENESYNALNEYENEFYTIDLKEKFKDNDGNFTDYFKEVASNLKVNPSDYEKLFNRFDTFVKLPTSDHFVYLIKPYATHKQFNVVLILGVKTPLPANDFHIIRLLIYRFVSEVAIKKLEEAERRIHSNYIFSIGHFLKHRIHPILTNLVKANEDLTEKYRIGDELQNSISLSRTALFSASVLDLYGKALQKRLTKKGYAEFSDERINELDLIGADGEIIQNTLKHHYLNDKDLNIKQLIAEIAELMKTERAEIQPQFEEGIDWDNLIIAPFIRYKIDSDNNVFLKPSKEIYHQFLHELFKNISKSENALGHKPSITYIKNENCVIISRQIDESDARNLEAAGISYDEYSFIEGEEISGLSLMQHYLDVLGLGRISHKLIEEKKKYYSRTLLVTKLVLHGLTEKENGQD